MKILICICDKSLSVLIFVYEVNYVEKLINDI